MIVTDSVTLCFCCGVSHLDVGVGETLIESSRSSEIQQRHLKT